MRVPRLHVADEGLMAGRELRFVGDRAHQLRNVLRLREGALIHPFNAANGEWRATLTRVARHELLARVDERVRPPTPEPGPSLVFAPIRRNRLDWLVEKAVELGVGRLTPVLTERTVARPEAAHRLQAVATEAAEQSERLTVPVVDAPRTLPEWLASRDAAVPILLADERGQGAPPIQAMAAKVSAELVVGPEGGFAPRERGLLLAVPGALPMTLGRRILRAETAALYLLVCWQACRAGTAR
jgi:16S rRNA (uracil1498-N3)-methyltransferase